MKLLFDQNLSRLLVEHLRDVFPESVHVAELGFESETDFGIWQYAKAHDYIVVSKDSASAMPRPPRACTSSSTTSR